MDVKTKFEVAIRWIKKNLEILELEGGLMVLGPQWWISKILFCSLTQNPTKEVETKIEVATPIIEKFTNLVVGRGAKLWNSKIWFNSFSRYRHKDVDTKVATPNKEEFRNFWIWRGVWGPQWWISEI